MILCFWRFLFIVHFLVITGWAHNITERSTNCPWKSDYLELRSLCICAYNLKKELSVQCEKVNFLQLAEALGKYFQNKQIDLLFVNNSSITELRGNLFSHLQINNIQFNDCDIASIHESSFIEQTSLKHLNLHNNQLKDVPTNSLKHLEKLDLLDLSKNRLKVINDDAFAMCKKLFTLKLNENDITIKANAFRGLDNLRNLNLRNTKQKMIPESLQNLKNLNFVDLSQNSIRELPSSHRPHIFDGLKSLTALNLERNLIHTIKKNAFFNIRNSLTSLSLLNNLIDEFPVESLRYLKDLKVLDIGFNLLTEIPVNAFQHNPLLTLLAVDGNPLRTISMNTLIFLNNTLKGLSLGGRYLVCDCKLRWIAEWIRKGDLQVTSRERNPQFCGYPQQFRDKGFYSIEPESFTCEDEEFEIKTTSTTTPASTTTTTVRSTSTLRNIINTTVLEPSSTTIKITTEISSVILQSNNFTTNTNKKPTNRITNKTTTTTKPTSYHVNTNLKIHNKGIHIKNAFAKENSVSIEWETKDTVFGFRVIYRIFGDKNFKFGPPLERSEREFKIKNVPSSECIVVCVISIEDLLPPENIDLHQCREIRARPLHSSEFDRITTATSIAICTTILIAVIILCLTFRKKTREYDSKFALPHENLDNHEHQSAAANQYNAFCKANDWDQISAYSENSTSHPQHVFEFRRNSTTNKKHCQQLRSQQSFPELSHRSYLHSNFPNNLFTPASNPSRLSRHSTSERLSRHSFAGSIHTHSSIDKDFLNLCSTRNLNRNSLRNNL